MDVTSFFRGTGILNIPSFFLKRGIVCSSGGIRSELTTFLLKEGIL